MKRRVLVVEDDPDILLMLRMSLSLAGYEVTAATTGEEALVELHLARPEVVLLDLGLPGIDGREVLRRVRDDRTLDWIPVLILTAHASPTTLAELVRLGCQQYLTKPFDHQALLRTLAALASPMA